MNPLTKREKESFPTEIVLRLRYRRPSVMNKPDFIFSLMRTFKNSSRDQELRGSSSGVLGREAVSANRLAHATALAHFIASNVVRELMGEGSFAEKEGQT